LLDSRHILNRFGQLRFPFCDTVELEAVPVMGAIEVLSAKPGIAGRKVG